MPSGVKLARLFQWMWIGVSIFIALLGLSIGGYFVRQNGIIERQNERLQQDSVTMAKHLLQISVQNDSIALQNSLILSQRDSIEYSIRQLQLSNMLLAEEKENVLKTNWNLKISNAQLLSEKSIAQLNEGNLLKAQKTIRQLCCDSHVEQLLHMPEVEFSIRKVYRAMTQKGIRPLFTLDNMGNIQLAQFGDDGNELYIVSNDSLIKKYNNKTGELFWDRNVLFYENNAKTEIWSFDPQIGNLYYSIDHTAFIKNVYSDKIISSIPFLYRILDIQVSPQHDYLLCHLITDKGDDEFHLVFFKGNSYYKFIIPECEEVFAISPDGKTILADIEDNYCIYDIQTKTKVKNIPYKRYDNIREAHFTNDGAFIIIKAEDWSNIEKAGSRYHLDFFDNLTNEFVEIGHEIKSELLDVIQEDPKQNIFVVGDMLGELTVYNTTWWQSIFPKGKKSFTNILLETLSRHSERIESITFSHDGTKMLTVSNGMLCVWNVNVENYFNKESYVFVGANGKCFVKTKHPIGQSPFAQLFDVQSQKPIGNSFYFNNNLYDIRLISWNNNVVVTRDHHDSLIHVINPITNHHFAIPFNNTYHKLSLDKNGNRIAVLDRIKKEVNENIIKIFDINKERLINQKKTGKSLDIALSPNGKDLAISEDYFSISIYDAETLRRKRDLPKIHKREISSICYSPDGKYIATASWDRTICVWEANTGAFVERLTGADHELWKCSFSSDGQYILAFDASTVKENKNITRNYIWNVVTKQIVEIIDSENSYSFCQDVENKIYTSGWSSSAFLDFPSTKKLIKFFSSN